MPKESSKKSAAKKKVSDPDAGMEDAMRQLEEMLTSSGMVTKGDLDALMTSLTGPSAREGLSDTEANARDEAQQWAFEAMEATSAAQARKLAAGERSLGEKFIRENKGHFWLLLETRPTMRAMEQLAGLLRGEGISLDAIGVYKRMLELNPNDNQGVRDPLLGLYLETGDLRGARELLDKFKEDASANFAWARVLERFLAGKRDEARAALKKARRTNRHVELYLAVRKTLPKHPPEMYSPGSEEEAALCVGYLSGAWAAHKEAVFWLLDQLAADGLLRIPSKAGGRPTSQRLN